MSINPTQAAGLLSFGSAAIAIGGLGLRAAGVPRRGTWQLLALVHALFAIEVMVGARHMVHELMNDYLRLVGLHGERQVLQAWIVSIGFVALGLLTWAAWRVVSGFEPSLRLAVVVTAGVSILMLLEVLSLHVVDRLVYANLGGILLIGWLWVACGLACVGAVAWRLGAVAWRR